MTITIADYFWGTPIRSSELSLGLPYFPSERWLVRVAIAFTLEVQNNDACQPTQLFIRFLLGWRSPRQNDLDRR